MQQSLSRGILFIQKVEFHKRRDSPEEQIENSRRNVPSG